MEQWRRSHHPADRVRGWPTSGKGSSRGRQDPQPIRWRRSLLLQPVGPAAARLASLTREGKPRASPGSGKHLMKYPSLVGFPATELILVRVFHGTVDGGCSRMWSGGTVQDAKIVHAYCNMASIQGRQYPSGFNMGVVANRARSRTRLVLLASALHIDLEAWQNYRPLSISSRC